MKHEILNARQTDRDIYAGYLIDWEKWTDFLPKFICKCAQIARAKGYRVMGIQFYGECWGSMDGHLTYNKYGNTSTCLEGDVKDNWAKCGEDNKACTGEALTNFVYRIAPTECDTYYEPVGCFKDKGDVPRPIPFYAMNERDYTISNWNKHLIEWDAWATYSPKMICRCAAKAKSMGRTTFSLQFYGECWTGEEDKIEHDRDGKDTRCMSSTFSKCPYHSYHCVGKDHANMVYKLTSTPSPAKPFANPVKGDKLALMQDEPIRVFGRYETLE